MATTSDDEKRAALLNEIQAWREAREAQAEGSPWYKMFQNKMKRAEWKLQALGPSQNPPGIVINIVNPSAKR
jgi:hypothetical protein